MGYAFATASEDMDALTFGTNVLLRGFNSKKEPIVQIELKPLLEQFGMDMDRFIDVCILCGCDYTTNIHGIGPITAYNYIDEYECIENVVRKIERDNDNPTKKKKYHIPESFNYKEARDLFKEPTVERDMSKIEPYIKWT